MRTMSDLLSPDLLAPNTSYLVGYPLKMATCFVLARTWNASEMPRPGSVWTHSVLLDWSVLATLADPGVAASLLRRPIGRDLAFYGARLKIDRSARHRLTPFDVSHPGRRAALASLYNDNPEREVVAKSAGDDADEALALALWRQAWPALRRGFAFFAGPDLSRPAIDADCILFFISKTSPLPPSSTSAEVEALDLLEDDLPLGGPTALRSFVARHALTSTAPRAAVRPLVSLWRNLRNAEFGSALAAFSRARAHTSSPRLARDVIDLMLRDNLAADDLIRLVEVFGAEQIGDGLDLAPSLRVMMSAGLEASIFNLTSACVEGTFGWKVFEDIAANVPIERLVALPLDIASRLRLIAIRPALILHDGFWPAADAEREKMVRAAAALQVPLPQVVSIVERSPGSRALEALFSLWPEEAPVMLVERLAAMPDHRRRELANALGRRSDVLERSVTRGVRLPDEAVDDLVAAALAVGQVARPAQGFWSSLRQETATRGIPINLRVILFGSDLLDGGAEARGRLAAGFFDLYHSLERGRLRDGASRYLLEVFKSLGIHGWSTKISLTEAYWYAFRDGRGFDPAALGAASDVPQLDHLLEALRVRWGKSAVADLRFRMERRGDVDWRLGRTADFLDRHTSRSWWF